MHSSSRLGSGRDRQGSEEVKEMQSRRRKEVKDMGSERQDLGQLTFIVPHSASGGMRLHCISFTSRFNPAHETLRCVASRRDRPLRFSSLPSLPSVPTKDCSMHPLFAQADGLSGDIIGAAIEVHRIMGPGLLESFP
jgi:hypothetical protein